MIGDFARRQAPSLGAWLDFLGTASVPAKAIYGAFADPGRELREAEGARSFWGYMAEREPDTNRAMQREAALADRKWRAAHEADAVNDMLGAGPLALAPFALAMRGAKLPMDSASRMARADAMGFDRSMTWYRSHYGDPERGAVSTWSRDPERARNFAATTLQDKTEPYRFLEAYFRGRPLAGQIDYTYADVDRLARAIRESYGDKGASAFIKAANLGPDLTTLDALSRAAARTPTVPLIEGPPLVKYSLDQLQPDILRRAGFDYVISGKDAKLMNPAAARLAGAVFDPRRINEPNWLAGLLVAPTPWLPGGGRRAEPD